MRARVPPLLKTAGVLGACIAGATGISVVGLGLGLACRRRAKLRTELADTVVLITGGSRGLGFAIAREFAFRGARLALVSRHQEDLDRARVRLLREFGLEEGRLSTEVCDVASPQQVEALIASVTAHFGKIDVLVNNAGIITIGPVASQPRSHFEEAMRINFFGALHTAMAVLPQMIERGCGAIVNIGSVGGKIAVPHLLPYVASKFALVGWSQGLRAELAPKGIQVTTVIPGVMRTGSHIQAQFTGDAAREYGWFAKAATCPITAVDAQTAARKIMRAYRNNAAEVTIGAQAFAASRFANLAPEWTAAGLRLANRMLPDGGNHKNSPIAGKTFRHELPSLFHHFAEAAVGRYNQDA